MYNENDFKNEEFKSYFKLRIQVNLVYGKKKMLVDKIFKSGYDNLTDKEKIFFESEVMDKIQVMFKHRRIDWRLMHYYLQREMPKRR